jgi:hypothetical protein
MFPPLYRERGLDHAIHPYWQFGVVWCIPQKHVSPLSDPEVPQRDIRLYRVAYQTYAVGNLFSFPVSS